MYLRGLNVVYFASAILAFGIDFYSYRLVHVVWIDYFDNIRPRWYFGDDKRTIFSEKIQNNNIKPITLPNKSNCQYSNRSTQFVLVTQQGFKYC